MNTISKAALALLLLPVSIGSSLAGVRSIWATHDGTKVERDDPDHPAKRQNSVWNGQRVRLFGARNEIIAFQVIVEADASGITALSAQLPELRADGAGETISYRAPGSDPSNYVGREIEVFSVNYMNVTEPTRAGWIYRLGTPSAPKDPTGWKPVQLVPENARAGKGGFPLRVAPSNVQAVWFDIYLRRDLTPGLFRGVVKVTADGETRDLPIELEVLDLTLPDENSMHAMVYYERSQFDQYHGRDLDAQYHRFAHRQRIELVQAYNQAAVNSHSGRFSGADFTREKGYEGPGERQGNRIIPATFYGPGSGFDTPEAASQNASAWMSFLSGQFPDAITFVYMPDEPRRSEFARIRRLAENIHSSPEPGKRPPVLVTHEYTADLEGAIDIWCSGPQGFFVEKAKGERAKGRQYWVYNGGRPYGGAIVIDAPATDARAMIWGCFKHEIPVYFYWHGNHWRHNQQKPGNRIQNVWANPVTFDNRGQPNKPIEDQSFANGDGVLMYPGEEKLHTEEDRGIAGPCSTLQLANFRRGLQDHQYLTLARKAGLTSVVEEAVAKIVPRMFSDAAEQIGFSEDGDDYEAMRYRIGKALAGKH